MKRFRMPRRQKMFAVLPTLLTLGNAVCGFGAITFAAKVGLAERLGWGRTNTDCLWMAAVLIFLAMVFDMLDGRAARWAKQTSQFGAELDSLCDAISFGVAGGDSGEIFGPIDHAGYAHAGRMAVVGHRRAVCRLCHTAAGAV